MTKKCNQWKRIGDRCYRKCSMDVPPSIEELETQEFEGLVRKVILDSVEARARIVSPIPGLLTRRTYVERDGYIIDDKMKRAAWILREPTSRGYDNSLWYFQEGDSPFKLYQEKDNSMRLVAICDADITFSISITPSNTDWVQIDVKIPQNGNRTGS